MIDFNAEQLDRYLEEDAGGRVAMLNLLRFKPDGGRERYLEYAAAIATVGERYGADPLFVGSDTTLSSRIPGRSGTRWRL